MNARMDVCVGGFLMAKKKRRTGLGIGREEINLARFPLSILGDRGRTGEKTLVFEDNIWNEEINGYINRKVRILGSEAHGLPLARDEDVLIALLKVAKEINNYQKARVEFKWIDLLRILGWSTDGTSYRRVVESLQRWTATTIEYESGWWDASERVWRNESFHILDRATSQLGGEEFVFIVWGDAVFSSFQAGYMKEIDLDTYFSIGSDIAKRLYRILDFFFYRKTDREFWLSNLAFEKIGLKRGQSVGKIKQLLRSAINELVTIGFIEPLDESERYRKIKPGVWKIRFNKAGANKVIQVDAYAPHPVNDDPAVVEDLVLYKVSHEVAIDLYNRYGEDRIRTQLKFFEWRVKKGHSIGNSAGYLVKAIEKNYGAPDGFVDAPATSAPKPQDTALVAALAAQKVAREATAKKIEDYLSSLDEDELREIEEKALATASEELLEAIENATLPSVRNALVKARIREYVGSRDSD